MCDTFKIKILKFQGQSSLWHPHITKKCAGTKKSKQSIFFYLPTPPPPQSPPLPLGSDFPHPTMTAAAAEAHQSVHRCLSRFHERDQKVLEKRETTPNSIPCPRMWNAYVSKKTCTILIGEKIGNWADDTGEEKQKKVFMATRTHLAFPYQLAWSAVNQLFSSFLYLSRSSLARWQWHNSGKSKRENAIGETKALFSIHSAIV